MSVRRRHNGAQKICTCGRSRWPKCPHAWYLRFKTRRGTSAGIALDAFARIYVDRASKPSGKVSWAKDASMFDRFCAYRSSGERALGQWPLASITEDVIEAFFASLYDAARAEGPVADVRGNPVVNEATRERGALHHAEAEKASKDFLH
jgi:hypothetical protein